MNTDEYKALRLRQTQLRAELARIDVLLEDAMKQAYNGRPTQYNDQPRRPEPIKDDWGTVRKDFYRDAENDFRNADSNGNYITPEDC
jgi:hypothetical protein